MNTNIIPVESEQDSERKRDLDVLTLITAQATEENAFSAILAIRCISQSEIISRKDIVSILKIKIEISIDFDGFLAPISINFRVENKILN